MRITIAVGLSCLILLPTTGRLGMAQGTLDRLEDAIDQIPTPAALPRSSGYLGLVANEQTGRNPGVIVERVAPDGPAALVGIKPGDQVVSVNGQPIKSLDDMDRQVHKPAGTQLKLEIRRGNTLATVDLKLAIPPGQPAGPPTMDELPPPPPVAEAPELTGPFAAPQRASLGVNVVDVTPATRKQFRLTVSSGAVIRAIRPDSAAAKAGLPLGGAIIAVNGKIVKSADGLVAAIQPHRPGDVVEVTYYDTDRLARKKVELGAAAAMPPATAPTAPLPSPPSVTAPEPALRLGPGGRDRPPLDRIGKALDPFMPPESGASSAAPSPNLTPTPAATAPATQPPLSTDIAALRQQITMLQQQLQQLQQRIDQLEQKINSPAPDKP